MSVTTYDQGGKGAGEKEAVDMSAMMRQLLSDAVRARKGDGALNLYRCFSLRFLGEFED